MKRLFVWISFVAIYSLTLSLLAGCAGTPAPRDALDGSQYARASLDSIYDTASYLRKTGRLSDDKKQAVLDAGAQFEVVLQMVEDGKNSQAGECLKLVNGGLDANGQPPLLTASSCLDAAIQGLTLIRNLLGGTS